MIPHHAQAIEMAKLADKQAANPQVKELAAKIERAQGPEIEQMAGFLRSWGANIPSTSPGMAGMDHGGTSGGGQAGMMSDAQMQQLGAARGAEFDRMFLQMMIQHLRGAIEMAQTELRNGRSQPAKQLAQQIVGTQQAELTTMQTLLKL